MKPRPAHQAETWPKPADAQAAARLMERFVVLGAAEARLAASRRGAAALNAIGGNSPYLSELVLRDPGCLRTVLAEGPQSIIARVLQRLADTPPTTRRPALSALLRQSKRQVALATGAADLCGAWPLEKVVAALSAFADACLRLSVNHLLLDAAARHELRVSDPNDPARDTGFIVLGMGKLGARELNYSSDIDLVLLYDPAAQMVPRADGSGAEPPEELAATFSRLARALVSLLQQRDAEGYVFRTDLRLRPDPAATPLAVSLPAALTYYESLGQNWERAAMLKARPVAGDLAAGQDFLDAIRPFVWRRRLDFAALADIHAMKRRIDAHRAAGRPAGQDMQAQNRLLGFDLKLGAGGIREIEFLAQTLQLVWGGRDPTLRDPTTLGALRALVRAGHLKRGAAEELEVAYRLLRTLEHRAQMVSDRQTHALPPTLPELDRFAIFCGLPSGAALAAILNRELERVRRRYLGVFEAVPPAAEEADALDFSGPDAQPATLARLHLLGFAGADTIVDAVHGWQAGRPRALRSERARLLLAQLLPELLAALGRQPQPDQAFARFDRFIQRLPAGVQLLSLMERNPALIDRVATVLGAAPSLADHLARVPQALEGLLVPGQDAGPRAPPARLLRERLADARGLEDAIVALRDAAHALDFSLSLDTLEGRIDADRAGLARTALADAVIAALLPFVLADIRRRFGTVPGGAVAVVALGKAGSREMMAGSDLDLMLVYDSAPGATESRIASGATGRAVPVAQYYTRVAHGFIAALTAPGPEGPLYAVDMRLRPSGNAGPVAVSLAAFRRYHREHAWTWERMAITRARVIAAPPILSARVSDALRNVIEYAGANPDLARDAATMRARLARDMPPRDPWDVKHRPGGLMEVEFIAQSWQLMHAGRHPDIVHPTTRVALAALRDAGLLSDADAGPLIGADHLWRTVQGMLRVTLGRNVTAILPQASAEALLRAVGRADVTSQPALLDCMDQTGAKVRALFERLVGTPDLSLLEKTA